MYLCLHVLLTEFIQFAELDLLHLASLQVNVKYGPLQSKPPDLGPL